jgi:hypothetical protein
LFTQLLASANPQEPLAIIIFTEAGHHLGSLLSGLVFADSDFTIVTTD